MFVYFSEQCRKTEFEGMGWEEWKDVYVVERYELNSLEFKLEKYIYF